MNMGYMNLYNGGCEETDRINQELGAEEADTPQDLHDFGDEAHMKNWLGQLNMAKVPWTFGHVTWETNKANTKLLRSNNKLSGNMGSEYILIFLQAFEVCSRQ